MRLSPVQRLGAERRFLVTLGAGFVIVGLTYRHPSLAAWVGFALAGYSVVANDSIQTIGTFLSSNHRVRWQVLWMFIAGIFAVTTVYGWANHGGDVSYGRLSAKGFQNAPTSFGYLQLAAPLFLLVLTRLRMPVSTTFLILSSFASKAKGIKAVMFKSLSGYGVAFVSALLLWPILTPMTDRMIARGKAHHGWRVAQWITTGFLWSVWLMQDAANVAVYLPRSLSLGAMFAYVAMISFGLAILIVQRGGRIQAVVGEKTNVLDVRPATLIDLVYGTILYVFKVVSKVPMSTTWVFIGLLGGRELVINLVTANPRRRSLRAVGRVVAKDVALAGVGLIVSLVLALIINPVVREALFS